ncbi:MAG: bifunctional DNA-formamidopyrimidine glycosylase/DNA-(apurinic or apyrimidinic site) lyase [Candidatus Omnitrophica bacterium]|nr:bifunctional DNA-formamidopyrimidine glycosylase/DNA-(apurinic or apyrimidinic site) lyase [Candidatus Omnitrophota bacterium]
MPELPEVENIVLDLKNEVVGRSVSGVKIYHSSILATPRKELEKGILGQRILQIGRRGKFIRIDLSGNLILWIHLGMTGQLLLEDSASALRPHTHFVLAFEDSGKCLRFRDPRRFGRIAFTSQDKERFPEGVRRLGPEPQEWNKEDFVSLLKRRRARIKSLLLDQRVVAGVGNIYADESLYRAGIHPLRRAERVPKRRLLRLYDAISEVLEEATQLGGSSIDDYLHLDGEKGRFQEFHQVYGRVGERCSHCGSEIRRIKLAGRSSFFCSQCQR